MSADPAKNGRLIDLLSRRNEIADIRRAKRLERLSKPTPADVMRDGEAEMVPVDLPPRKDVAKTRHEKVAAPPPEQFLLPERAEVPAAIFALPQRAPQKSWGTMISFLLMVLLPVVVAGVYYYGIASPQYVSEFRFAVRNAQASISGGASEGGSILGAVTGQAGTNALENYMVVDYLMSDPGLQELESRIDVRSMYESEDIDLLSRLPVDSSREAFVRYWKSQTRAAYDQVTGITTVQVRSFRPEDALLIANTMTGMSEELIKRIAHRPQQDAVKFAEQDLQQAEDRLRQVSADMTLFRNTERVIEPNANVVSSNTQLATTLRAELSQLQTTLSSMAELSPTSPVRRSLQARVKATREELAAVENEISEPNASGRPISSVVGRYEELDLERTFAQDVVKSALRNLETARSNALLQHMYVVPFVEPVQPSSSIYPNRLMSTLFAAVVCLLVWAVGLLLFRSVREHIA